MKDEVKEVVSAVSEYSETCSEAYSETNTETYSHTDGVIITNFVSQHNLGGFFFKWAVTTSAVRVATG